jgi:hypothetical protein
MRCDVDGNVWCSMGSGDPKSRQTARRDARLALRAGGRNLGPAASLGLVAGLLDRRAR